MLLASGLGQLYVEEREEWGGREEGGRVDRWVSIDREEMRRREDTGQIRELANNQGKREKRSSFYTSGRDKARQVGLADFAFCLSFASFVVISSSSR